MVNKPCRLLPKNPFTTAGMRVSRGCPQKRKVAIQAYNLPRGGLYLIQSQTISVLRFWRRQSREFFYSILSLRNILILLLIYPSKSTPTTLVQLPPPPSTLPTNTCSAVQFAHTNPIPGSSSCASRTRYNWDCGNWFWKNISIWTPDPRSYSLFPSTCKGRQALAESSHSCTNS